LTASTESAPLIPNKRVHYTFGMVLGVDDFRQEQAHFEWKQQLSNLLLHGYGTVCGLQVSAKAVVNPSDVEIRVSAGYGISPQGRWMWVERDQCARLNDWLQRHKNDKHSPLPGSGRKTVYVKICYSECPTDVVPIAGHACASDEDTRAASRIQEAFQVEFSWQRPAQPAEDLFRAFGELLAQVEITSAASPPVFPDDGEYFLDLVRNLGIVTLPPLASPPAGEPIRLAGATACDTLRQALTIWVTEVCPRITPKLQPTEEDCILLACIHFDIDANGNLSFQVDAQGDLVPGSVEVDDCARPVLVPDRLKQELFCRIGREGTASASDHGALGGLLDDDHPQYHTDARGDARYAPLNHTHALNDLFDVNAPTPNNGQVLTRQGGQWVAATPPAGVTVHGDLSGLGADDHPQYLLINGGRALTGDLSAGGNKITDLAAATTNGDAVPFQQAIKVNDTAGGDLNGAYPAPTVARLRGRNVAPTVPTNGQVLTWNQAAAQWEPQVVTTRGNFVRAPDDRYAIIAAGFFDSLGQPQGPVYNDLKATPLAAPRGDYVLNFRGYRPPDGFMYIVKGTVQDSEDTGGPRATFQFVRFQQNGIRVRVLATDRETTPPGFMVEISVFGAF
jgi:hypothetical protein